MNTCTYRSAQKAYYNMPANIPHNVQVALKGSKLFIKVVTFHPQVLTAVKKSFFVQVKRAQTHNPSVYPYVYTSQPAVKESTLVMCQSITLANNPVCRISPLQCESKTAGINCIRNGGKAWQPIGQ